jgi:sugar phosphate isomerase/epimerase
MDRSPRPAIQLNSLRGTSESLPDVIRRVGDAGFEGVEFADRFREADPDAVDDALDDGGVDPVAVHAALDDVEAAVGGENDLLDRCETVGCDRVVVSHASPRHLRSRSAVRSLSYRLAGVAHELDARDVDLGYHTARRDLYPLLPDGLDALLDRTPVSDDLVSEATRGLGLLRRADPKSLPSDTTLWNLFARTAPDDLFFELDTGETVAGGFDPVPVLGLFAGRVPLVHLTDAAQTGDRRAYQEARHGEGEVDLEAVVAAARTAGAEWIVFEDDLDRDPAAKIADGTDLLGRLLGDGSEYEAGRPGDRVATPD